MPNAAKCPFCQSVELLQLNGATRLTRRFKKEERANGGTHISGGLRDYLAKKYACLSCGQISEIFEANVLKQIEEEKMDWID